MDGRGKPQRSCYFFLSLGVGAMPHYRKNYPQAVGAYQPSPPSPPCLLASLRGLHRRPTAIFDDLHHQLVLAVDLSHCTLALLPHHAHLIHCVTNDLIHVGVHGAIDGITRRRRIMVA